MNGFVWACLGFDLGVVATIFGLVLLDRMIRGK
jgi:hypothetical protein